MALNFFDYLKNIGISEKEISIYIYLLSVDSALPMEISKGTKMKRSTVYVILELLKKKGLVRKIQRGRRHAYIAEDPERIKFLLEELKLQTEQSIMSVDAILPQLKATIRKHGEPPLIKYFEGESAVQASMEALAANPRVREDLDYGVFPMELVHKLFASRNLRKFIDFRITENKSFKILYTSEEGELPHTYEGQDSIRIDHKKYPLLCDISVFEDEVRFHMLGKSVYGILIKNQELATTLISLIELASKGAKQKEG